MNKTPLSPEVRAEIEEEKRKRKPRASTKTFFCESCNLEYQTKTWFHDPYPHSLCNKCGKMTPFKKNFCNQCGKEFAKTRLFCSQECVLNFYKKFREVSQDG